ncbi:TPA: hypothetical protein N0F65_006807 [Lagenidium giganteum]|uniref:PX domain-containing protein n=1 Tax=Lagenidium giganteum TaxID=4803 RepID=A0AAV2Z887_9STRA|nr:TPA: hypothetical protein N0F65_006807 [Lagenidium giganteum]
MLATLDLPQRRVSSSDSSQSSQEADIVVQSLPYGKHRESLSAVLGADRANANARRISATSTATTSSDLSSPEDQVKTSLSYSVPSVAVVTNTPRSRPPVDVIATYTNTPNDNRNIKSDLLRSSHAHFPSPRAPQNRVRTSSGMSREASADWGWFADIDSSSESWGGDGSMLSWKRKLSADLGAQEGTASVYVLGDEQANTRLTAAHKTFTITTDGKSKVVSTTVSIPKFRIVQSRTGGDRHAQYLITLKMGKDLYADWRRYSEFGELAKKLHAERYKRSIEAWKGIDSRWFNRLEPSYLHQKCITLENFMRELMYESHDPTTLLDFLGGYQAKVNSRPSDPVTYRPSAQLPKEMRPPQPRHERELFEKMWAENFKRSRVNYSDDPTDKA